MGGFCFCGGLALHSLPLFPREFAILDTVGILLARVSRDRPLARLVRIRAPKARAVGAARTLAPYLLRPPRTHDLRGAADTSRLFRAAHVLRASRPALRAAPSGRISDRTRHARARH